MTTQNEVRLLRARDAADRVGVHRTHIYRLMKTAGFPRPVHLGVTAPRWRSDEVDRWIEQRTAERDQEAA